MTSPASFLADVSEAVSPTTTTTTTTATTTTDTAIQHRMSTVTNETVISKTCHYMPDFTVKALCDLEYLRIARLHYIAAVRATCLERSPNSDNPELWKGLDRK